MKRTARLVGTVLLIATSAYGQTTALSARTELRTAQGETVGRATFAEDSQGVTISLEVEKLPPGPHGIHIHAVGKCDPPDFASAAGHFNPEGRKHGLKNPEGPHAGDLPNLIVGSDGRVQATMLASRVTLGPGPHSLFQPAGTALVIHAGPDDEMSDPAGNSGARIACGVITP